MAPHAHARSRIETLFLLGLCGAVTVPARGSAVNGGQLADGAFADARAAALAVVASHADSSVGSTGGTSTRSVNPSMDGASSRGALGRALQLSAGTPPKTASSLASVDVSSEGAVSSKGRVSERTVELGTMRPVWPTSEVTLTVDESYLALPHAMTALEGALQAWTSRCSWLPKVALRIAEEPLGAQTAEQNLNDHRIFFSPFGDVRAKGALAVTLVTADEGNNTIIDADILVNGGHLFTDVTRLNPEQSTSQLYDLQNVLAHEFGHWFGLDENLDNPDATMYAFVFPGERNKRDLSDDDVHASEQAHLQAQYADVSAGGCVVPRMAPSPSQRWGDRMILLGCLLWFERIRGRRRNRGD